MAGTVQTKASFIGDEASYVHMQTRILISTQFGSDSLAAGLLNAIAKVPFTPGDGHGQDYDFRGKSIIFA